MKAIYSFIFYSIPLFSIGQYGEYCPCMEEDNNMDDISSFVSDINDGMFDFSVETTTVYESFTSDESTLTLDFLEEAPAAIMLFEKEEKEHEALPVAENNRADPSIAKADWGYSKAYIKNSKKNFRVKRTRRARGKKYKGKCPFF